MLGLVQHPVCVFIKDLLSIKKQILYWKDFTKRFIIITIYIDYYLQKLLKCQVVEKHLDSLGKGYN